MNTKYDPNIHRRRSLRLPGYDYAQSGAYFITICTNKRECLFGEIKDGEMRLNSYGNVVAGCWRDTPLHFRGVSADFFIVMPNHIHGVIQIESFKADNIVGATHASPLRNRPRPTPQSIGAIIGSFKSAVTRRINASRQTAGLPVWQRKYYEHVIRDEKELGSLLEYIACNPAKWVEDEDNPNKPM